jgi:methyl-accepting chemotaxis protein
MFDAAAARIIEIIAGVGGIAGVIAFVTLVFRERDAGRRQKLLELEAAANRQNAVEERAGYRILVDKVLEVVEANSRASEAIRQTMANVCSMLGVHDNRSIEVAAGMERVESRLEEVHTRVADVDAKVTAVGSDVNELHRYVKDRLQ